MTPRPWTARHRDAMLTRVTVLTAGTAVLGTVGAVGIGVALALTSHPKAAAVRTASIDPLPSLDALLPSDAPTTTTPSPTPTPTRTVVKVATTRTTPAAKPVSRPTVTKRATPRPTPTPTRTWTPPPAPPRPSSTPTVTSGGS